MKKLPIEFIERMKRLLGNEYELYEKAVNSEPVKGFRVNTDKISINDFLKINTFGNEKIPYVDNGFYLDGEKIGNHPYHHAGMIYIQEPAAMAPAECVEVKPYWNILDMCAAPGGKSTQLKNKIPDGVLVSNEIVMNRCKTLTGNIERLGLNNCITTCVDTSVLAEQLSGMFDMVMVDAPCSGEGMFRKDDTAIAEWSEENVLLCAKRQADILDNAAVCLKNGGYIVYATCTFSIEENEKTVDCFLERHPDFELIDATEKIISATSDGICFEGCKSKELNKCRRFYPHKGRGEGQFMAVLHSKAKPTITYDNCILKSDSKNAKIVYDFLDDVLEDYEKEAVFFKNEKISYYTALFNPKVTSFSFGVSVGEVKKNYILPHHQFFMAFGKSFKRKINFTADSLNLTKYLHGEEFETDIDNGWAVIMVEGCAVGGVKVSSGIAKNHYPKGLRLL